MLCVGPLHDIKILDHLISMFLLDDFTLVTLFSHMPKIFYDFFVQFGNSVTTLDQVFLKGLTSLRRTEGLLPNYPLSIYHEDTIDVFYYVEYHVKCYKKRRKRRHESFNYLQ